MPSSVTLLQLEYFVTAVEHASLSAATAAPVEPVRGRCNPWRLECWREELRGRAPREAVAQAVDQADARPDDLVEELGVGRRRVRPGGRQLLRRLHLLPELHELLARDARPELRELLGLLVADVVGEDPLQLVDQGVEA